MKRILSGILAVLMLLSVISVAGVTASAATESEVALPENIQDGLILHAFCWGYSEIEDNLDAIAAAGYTAIQTSPVQQPKDMTASTDITGQWWKLYQPVSLSIGDNTWLGTKEELISLCAAAKERGIKIICDVITNHLGASSTEGAYVLADEVARYEPTLWGDNGGIEGNSYFHQVWNDVDESSIRLVTQGWLSGCPDLNTGNGFIQENILDLLKECIDCGVSGFRFDAAKHIETPDDGVYASNFWSSVVGRATDYAAEKDIDLYCYGEVLNTPGTYRSYSSYTNQGLSITDNGASADIRNGITNGSAYSVAKVSYNVGEASDAVLWAEYHDSYLGTSESTTALSNEDIVKIWAIVASRKDATALFFPRTDSMLMGGAPADSTYKSLAVAEINRFHNECVGESETLGSSGSFAYVVRGQKGIVISNTNGTSADISIDGINLPDGNYTDMITGNKFTVVNGILSGEMGSTGVAVVTNGTTTPTVSADKENQTFEGETITVTLSLNNATSGTYQLDNYKPVEFTGSTVIRMGSDYNYGDTFKLTLTATDGVKTTSATYKYTKKQAASSGVYAMIPKSLVKSKKWTAPLYCYMYDEESDSKYIYENGAWPGEQMQYDETLDCYYIQVKDSGCVTSNKSTGEKGTAEFNMAESAGTCVIFSDSSSSSGSSYQHPGYGSSLKLKLNGKSHILNAISNFNINGWIETEDVPSSASVEATEVFRDYIPETTAPTTATETTETTETETTASTAVTTEPVESSTNGTTKPATSATEETKPTTDPTESIKETTNSTEAPQPTEEAPTASQTVTDATESTDSSTETTESTETEPSSTDSSEPTTDATETTDDSGHSHKWQAIAVTKIPTCLEKGEIAYACQCGETKIEEVDAKGHSYDEGITLAEPTCTTSGMKLCGCEVCGYYGMVSIPAKGHTEVTAPAVAPSCTMDGLTEGSHCVDCDEVFVPQEVVEKTGHSTKVTGIKKATYFENGYTGDSVCTNCGVTVAQGKKTAKIKLKKPTVKIQAGKSKFTVKYTKLKNATGFQIRYTGKGETVTVTCNTKKSAVKVIKGVSKGTYKVQVRAFIKKGNKKALGNWTSVKKVKIK